jgi:hypothetical protein
MGRLSLMSRVATVYVGSCIECPFEEGDYIAAYEEHWCDMADRRILVDVLLSIPDWCPLEESDDE